MVWKIGKKESSGSSTREGESTMLPVRDDRRETGDTFDADNMKDERSSKSFNYLSRCCSFKVKSSRGTTRIEF